MSKRLFSDKSDIIEQRLPSITTGALSCRNVFMASFTLMPEVTASALLTALPSEKQPTELDKKNQRHLTEKSGGQNAVVQFMSCLCKMLFR